MMKECGDHNCHVDISPDQEYVAAGSTDGAVYIYDLTTGTCAAELHHKRSTRAVWCCSFSKNGR
ncbi:uncharacterized protein BJ171DRAFT_489975 [Polychytrium aggregatum]|uniref:uncharacterized protein n=1 Tax=Polychytrium aggregatum TaxID=110093 RepID=UPI0022FF32E5|nr:uncharacterized protein BJ171DRAFT_489975 [Polychytrium aggregatum]KAI9208774.1 hypothetical protein BJ171DRAFT_489975 [Polychytrium aggregatum]